MISQAMQKVYEWQSHFSAAAMAALDGYWASDDAYSDKETKAAYVEHALGLHLPFMCPRSNPQIYSLWEVTRRFPISEGHVRPKFQHLSTCIDSKETNVLLQQQAGVRHVPLCWKHLR